MSAPIVRTPVTIPAVNDHGDDIAHRFRYQWMYAAIICCMLLDDTEDVAEVFCEHHEDVLIKYRDGMFAGLQIKTRKTDQEVWKTSNKEVRKTCVRFAKLEANFPGQFRTFRFLTNHPLHTAKNGQNLRYVLQAIKAASSVSSLSSPAANFVRLIARDAACKDEVVFTALSKTDALDNLPKLDDIETRLVDTLAGVWTHAADLPYISIVRIARSLVSECERASSLAHRNVLPAYLSATVNPEEIEIKERLAGKRIDRSRMLKILECSLNDTSTLDGDPEAYTEPGAGRIDLLLRKIDAGGFSIVSRNSALDLRDKADYLGIVWINKYGRETGLQRYGHIMSLVLSDAATAFEATKTKERPFGIEMLSKLRSRFQERRTEGSQLFNCSNEHLEGFAYSLTSQCKVQWSLERPWEDK